MFSGITLATQNIQYLPLMDKQNYCTCSGYAPRIPYSAFVRPGESLDYWAMYHIPDVETVDVEIPGFDPIKNVPVS
ncbi:hypothetical protein EKD16_06835 [Streptomonospora litoralis]|uniref:Uncharacterized protein n=2 Tax=Streptomonospora litoralis TaxID=2498135 RepID=A0A4P6Q2Y7_9ACTN|nr:hypothetical protein EKD16_06835 [Streptomonospora litoralis]